MVITTDAMMIPMTVCAVMVGVESRIFWVQKMLVFFNVKEDTSLVPNLILSKSAIPRPDCDISDSILIPSDIRFGCKFFIKQVKLTFGFHSKTVDGVFDFFRSVMEEVTKTTA